MQCSIVVRSRDRHFVTFPKADFLQRTPCGLKRFPNQDASNEDPLFKPQASQQNKPRASRQDWPTNRPRCTPHTLKRLPNVGVLRRVWKLSEALSKQQEALAAACKACSSVQGLQEQDSPNPGSCVWNSIPHASRRIFSRDMYTHGFCIMFHRISGRFTRAQIQETSSF